MSKVDKIKNKLYRVPPPTDFTWDELRSLLLAIGFTEKQGSGSRVKFSHECLDYPINIHRPHPQNTLKRYSIEQIKEALDELQTLLGN